jgi:hypothetical protein
MKYIVAVVLLAAVCSASGQVTGRFYTEKSSYLVGEPITASNVVGQLNSQTDQTFEVTLPPKIRSELVQINYFLNGAFGGYGSIVKPEVGKRSYLIPTTVEGKSANSLKAIVYSPGCKFLTFNVPNLSAASPKGNFKCIPLSTISLSGRIQQPESLSGHEYEVEIILSAPWGMSFFGIEDGAVPSFHIANVTPNADGSFHVRLPRFVQDATASRARLPSTFRFAAREKRTGNGLGALFPADAKNNQFGGLRLQSRYSGEVLFSIQYIR